MATKKVGDLIKEARTNAGLSQEALAKKIDGLSTTETTLSQLMKQEGGIATAKEPLGEIGTCFLFPKNEQGKVLVGQMDEFLTGLKESGELARIHAAWTGNDESLKVLIPTRSRQLTAR